MTASLLESPEISYTMHGDPSASSSPETATDTRADPRRALTPVGRVAIAIDDASLLALCHAICLHLGLICHVLRREELQSLSAIAEDGCTAAIIDTETVARWCEDSIDPPLQTLESLSRCFGVDCTALLSERTTRPALDDGVAHQWLIKPVDVFAMIEFLVRCIRRSARTEAGFGS